MIYSQTPLPSQKNTRNIHILVADFKNRNEALSIDKPFLVGLVKFG